MKKSKDIFFSTHNIIVSNRKNFVFLSIISDNKKYNI